MARSNQLPRDTSFEGADMTSSGIQSWDRVKGTKRTRIKERIRVSLGAIFSTTVSC
jgi:hypothetical protein